MAIWGLNYVCLKQIFVHWPAPSAMFARFLVMWGGLIVACRFAGEATKLDRKDALAVFYFGFISMGLYLILFMSGVNLTSPPEASVIFSTVPLFTALCAFAIGREKWNFTTFCGIIIGVIGVAVIEFGGTGAIHGHLIGNLLVLGSALLWSHMALMMPKLLKKYSPLRLFTLSMVGGFPVMLAYGIIPTVHMNWATIPGLTWVEMAYSGIISGTVGFTFFYRGVKDIGPTRATQYQMLLPVWASLFAVLLTGEQLMPRYFLGGAFVIIGLAIASGLASKIRT